MNSFYYEDKENMAASATNLASKINPKVTTVKGKGPRKGSKAPTIIEVATSNPGLSSSEIGKIVGCSHVNVVNTLHRYGIDIQATDDYKSKRADVFAGLQQRILSSITDDAIKKTPAIQLVTAASILYDKERLERGESTQNISVLVGAIKDLQAMRQAQDINDD